MAEAIVHIHGLEEIERGQALTRLVTGLCDEAEAFKVKPEGEHAIAGESGVRVRVGGSGQPRQVDVFEAFWGDLRTRLSDKGAKTKAWDGLRLILYWFNPRFVLALKESTWATFSLIVGLVMLAMWYAVAGLVGLGLLAAVLNGAGAWAAPFVAGINGAIRFIANSEFYSTLAFVAVLAPISRLVDLAHFLRFYLRNELGAEGRSIRGKARERLARVLDRVLESGAYERVTVVAHSFGALIAVDVLADLKQAPPIPVHFVSLGGSLKLVALRSPWMRDELERCLTNPNLESWTDFFSPNDWMAGAAAVPGEYPSGYAQKKIRITGGFFGPLGQNHLKYLTQQAVVEGILAV